MSCIGNLNVKLSLQEIFKGKIFTNKKFNELKVAFFPLQMIESCGYDGISFNAVKHCFGSLHKTSLRIFNLSIQKGVTPIYKNNDKTDLGNYRTISVLPCFSKILEQIVYNRLCKHLNSNRILYKKQFRFQKGNSTEHAILRLVDYISNSFEKIPFHTRCFY